MVKRELDAVLVHVADMLSRWTNKRLRSTLHRVVGPGHLSRWPERYSIVYFCGPQPDTLIDSRDIFPKEEPLYPPIKACDYLTEKLMARLHYE